MNERPQDVSKSNTTEDETARTVALIRDGWWLLLMVTLLLLLLRTV